MNLYMHVASEPLLGSGINYMLIVAPCRAMGFVAELLRRLFDDRQVTLATAASDVYTDTLYQYHGWITSAAFTVALKVSNKQ